MVRYRIVLANNHAPFRQGLRRIIKEKPDLQVVGEAEDGDQLRSLLTLSPFSPHLVIIDPSLSDFQGIEAVRKVKAINPEVKVLIVSMHRDKEYLSQAIGNGAEGYVIKETVDKELLRAIDTIMQGRLYLPPFP